MRLKPHRPFLSRSRKLRLLPVPASVRGLNHLPHFISCAARIIDPCRARDLDVGITPRMFQVWKGRLVPQSTSTLFLFRNQTFRSLWIAALASNFGGLVQAVGAAWLMTSLSASSNMVALVQGSVALPIMIFSLLAGVFSDNFDRKRVMLTAQRF